jgi:23S rRNA pseudouridine1911/1915/1917 synthase
LKPRRVEFVVEQREAGERLDRVLVERVASLGRKRARELFAAGSVLSGGRPARAGAPAKAGVTISVELDEGGAAPDSEIALDVRLELEPVLVVFKPAGVPTAPLRPGEIGTLANAVVARYPETRGIGHHPREPGLVHRLDTETSGLLVVARSARAFATLSAGLGSERFAKRYLAVVEAELEPSGVIDLPLAPDPKKRGRVAAYAEPPPGYYRFATTSFRVIERRSGRTLVELEVKKAFRHQVRAHLAAIGAPLVGDTLYGGVPWPSGGARHALHASYVAWAGDATVASFRVEAGLPDDMRALLGG